MEILSRERVRELFDAALERSPHEIPTFLDTACGDNAVLRQEVESLLVSLREDHSFLQSPMFGMSATEVAARALDNGEESLAGQQVGPYRLVREIGRGGIGAVYLAARDGAPYHVHVALKVIKRGLDTDFILQRFRREQKILAALDHPNIARLIDAGMNGTGQPFFVMEFVDGEPIDDYVKERGLSTSERLRLFRQVCTAVEYAHRHRVIHRDIKASNILVTAEGVPKLLDFGVAKLLDTDSSTRLATRTGTAHRVMTPEYASPEQLRGLPVTEASDVYSLGVLLYELLTHSSPYHFRSREPVEILRTISEKEARKPSEAISQSSKLEGNPQVAPFAGSSHAESDSRNRRLRRDLDHIVLKALRQEPEHRYSTVERLSEDIGRHLERLPVKLQGDMLRYRSGKFFRRNRTYVLSILSVALVCLLLGSFLPPFSVRGKKISSVAVLPLINTGGDPNMDHFGAGITDNLVDKLSQLPGLNLPGRGSVFRYKHKSVDPRSVSSELKVETVLTGTIASDGDDVLIDISLSDGESGQALLSKKYRRKASEIQFVQVEIAQDVLHKLGWEISEETEKRLQVRGTDNSEAYALYLKGNYSWNLRTSESLLKAAEYYQRAVERDPKYAHAYVGLANSYSLLGAYLSLEPDESFGRAREFADQALAIDPSLPEAHTSKALILWLYDWDWNGADREFKRAIELNPNYPLAHHWYGLFLGEMDHRDAAIAEVERALQLDPLSVPIINDLGRVYFYARRYNEAYEHFRKAADRLMGARMGDHSELLAALLEQTGRKDELAAFYDIYDPGLHSAIIRGGLKGYWRERLRRTNGELALHSHYERAEMLARLGKNELAIENLEAAYKTHNHQMTQLKVNPAFDWLRSDPRFIALLHRMKLAS